MNEANNYALIFPCGCCLTIVAHDAHKSEVNKLYKTAAKEGAEVRRVTRDEAVERFCGPRCEAHARPGKKPGETVTISATPAAPRPQQQSLF